MMRAGVDLPLSLSAVGQEAVLAPSPPLWMTHDIFDVCWSADICGEQHQPPPPPSPQPPTAAGHTDDEDGNTKGAAVDIPGGCRGCCETTRATFSPCPLHLPLDDFPDGLWRESGGRDHRAEVS